MISALTRKLGLHILKTNVRAQKINGFDIEIFRMAIADFQVEDKVGRPRFFQETFLMANTKFEMILEMLFLKISNANVAFGKRTLMWKSYITNKTLPTTDQVPLVSPKKFVIAALDADNKTFVVHVAIQKQKKWLWTLPGRLQSKLIAIPRAEPRSGPQYPTKLLLRSQ